MEPKTFEEGLDIALTQLKEKLIEKHTAYGINLIKESEYETAYSIGTRIKDKVSRATTLASKMDNGINVMGLKDEPYFDCWRDIGGYGVQGMMIQLGYYTLPLEADIKREQS